MNIKEFRLKYHYQDSTEVMRQFLDIKFTHIECLVLFRIGDFYELFYEDAIKASGILNLTLTTRSKINNKEIPMCGMPYHALPNYLNKLLKEGYKVAICDQIETTEEAKKRCKALVRREVSRIITPGTIIEEDLITLSAPNYLATIAIYKKTSSICFVDLSTSKISVLSVKKDELINEISRINPKEILISEKYRNSDIVSAIKILGIFITFQSDSIYSYDRCRNNILEFYDIASEIAIGELNESEIISIGSIIEYISLTQKTNIPKLPKPKLLNCKDFMSIDESTVRNLEIHRSQFGIAKDSLFSTINHTLTKGGSRLLYEYLLYPLTDIKTIQYRLNITEFFYKNTTLMLQVRELLKETHDLERCITRLNINKATPRDLLAIKYTITIAEKLFALLMQNSDKNIQEIISPLVKNQQSYQLINDSIEEEAPILLLNGGVIKLNYHTKLNELCCLIENAQSAISKLCDKYRRKTKLDKLKISHNNILGLFIEVNAKYTDMLSDEVFIHRQTTANSGRYTTNELQDLQSKMINAKTLAIALEEEIYQEICSKICKNQELILLLSSSLTLLDVYCNFAHIACENNYCMPKITEDTRFEIKSGRHPVIEYTSLSDKFVSNDCNLSESNISLITGPNMAGKSTYLRQNALLAILSHIGSYVPAETATIGIVDKIFSRIGAGDNLNKGQSTFMLEMLETSAILAQASEKSLIILDEVGRGTSTYDGLAIAQSVLEYIHDKINARCLFATHYHELTALSLSKLCNYTIAIRNDGDRISFLYKIIEGVSSKSHGLYVAKLAGLPAEVIERAGILLRGFED